MVKHHRVIRVKEPDRINVEGGSVSGWFFGELAERIAPQDDMTVDEREEIQNSLLLYTQHTFPGYKADEFHRHVCKRLTEIVTGGEAKYVMLFAPPQTGKSEIVSTRLPSFWLSHNPDLPVGLISYGASLAYRNSRNARSVFESPFYKQIFPEFQKDIVNWRVADWHLYDQKGYTMAAGVGGAITGHGFGLGIIDDPIENWAAGQSETIRESLWEWWLGTFKTRMWEQGSIILMMTRWNEDDLAGRILEREGRVEEGGKWEVLSYSALAEEENAEDDIIKREYGEAIAPSRYSSKYLEALKLELGDYIWNAEYQQRPSAPQGTFFKIGKINIVDAVPAEICNVIKLDEISGYAPTSIKHGTRYWDLAATEKKTLKKDPDSTSGSLVADHESIYYLLDNINEQLGPYEVQDIIKLTAKVDGKAVRIRIEQEPGAAGKSLIADYIRVLTGFMIEGALASGDKMVKASAYASQVNAGNVKFLKAPWNKKVLAQMASFPQGVHDDDVDSGAGAFNDIASADQWGGKSGSL